MQYAGGFILPSQLSWQLLLLKKPLFQFLLIDSNLFVKIGATALYPTLLIKFKAILQWITNVSRLFLFF